MPRQLNHTSGNPASFTTTIDYFRGVDLTSSPINVVPGRAFDAPNMIRDVPGKVRKRLGYYIDHTYTGRINGIYRYDQTILVHAGTGLYVYGDDTPISSSLPDSKSQAYRLNDKLMILTGQTLFVYYKSGDSFVCVTAESIATTPVVSIGRAPTGGGDTYPVNMLTDKFTDSFLGTADATDYQLSYSDLSSAAVTARVLQSDNTWTEYTEGSGITVNRTTGVVTFSTAPGAPPVSGEDNVEITAWKVHSDYKDRVNKCRFGIIYGANGAMDRLFISGNPDYPNYDWHCRSNDCCYFEDISYGGIGKEASAITGYSVADGYLATHKREDDTERNCYLRQGVVSEDTDTLTPAVTFPARQVIQGPGAIAPNSFAYLEEPLYLTDRGIYATTPYEYSGRLYTQKRSYYLDGKLLEEANLQNAEGIAYHDFYLLALNGKVYILDTLQRDSSNVSRGSQYQYEGYYWTNIPVRVWFTYDDELYFGTEDGKVCRFYKKKFSNASYNDAGRAIDARWNFFHTGANLHHDKTLRWIATNIATTPNSSFDLYYRRSVDPSFEKQAFALDIRYFAYDSLDYAKLVYGGSQDPKTLGKRIKIKRYDSAVLSLRNSSLNEGVFIYAVTLEYEEGRNYKLFNI